MHDEKQTADPQAGSEAPKVTIGRIVRYTTQDGQERAALVSVVHSGTEDQLINLLVAETHGFEPQTSIPFGGPDKPNTWFWPERQ